MSSSKNLEYKKTAFLSKSNNAFIEEMYMKFVNNDPNLPDSWREYFNEIGDEAEVVVKEINGPSWSPSPKKILSKDKVISCATCHVLSKDLKDKDLYLKALTSKINGKTDCIVCHLSDQSATDRFETSVGHGGAKNPFHLNTLTTLNAALAKYQTWDGSVKTVEEQVGLSIQDPTQMNLSKEEVVKRLLLDATYVKKFELSFDKVLILLGLPLC